MNLTIDTLKLFKALADPVRLRILRAVSIAELSVAELVSVLGAPQSTVSRHLKPLRDAGLVETRRDATSVFYRRGQAMLNGALSDLLGERLKELPDAQEDKIAVRQVMDMRRMASRDFFDKIAGRYHSLTEPGGGWEALSSALAVGFAGREVADLGAGEGTLAVLLARFARKVVAVDQSPRMLDRLQEAAEAQGVADKIELVTGDLEALPLPDESMDAVFLSQTLHHAAQPAAAIGEAVRILRKGGHLVVLDLVKHEHEWVREEWADLWLGFELEEVKQWMNEHGVDPAYVDQRQGAAPDLPVLLAVGVKR